MELEKKKAEIVKEIYEISVKALSNLHQISNDALQNITSNKESLE